MPQKAPQELQKYATRLEDIEPFKVMRLLARANELEAQGRPVVHMEVGEPDFPTPAAIIKAGHAALRDGRTRYTPALGIPELREAIASHYQETYNLQISPARVIVTAGGSGALLLACALTVDPGQTLLLTDPGYPCNRHFLKCLGGDGQRIPVSANENYQLDAALINQCWQERTAGVLLASPANPTGAIIPEKELKEIVDTVRSLDGHLIMDEIYHGLHYTSEYPVSALEVSDDAIVVNSFSKYFGMTGWRLGWLVVPEEAVPHADKLAQNLFICASSIAQHAALAAFTSGAQEEMATNRHEMHRRRDFLLRELRSLGFDIANDPDGAFYIYARLPSGTEPSEAFCDRLLEEHNVAITPGTDFGQHQADEHVRFSFAQSLSELEKGIGYIRCGLGLQG